MRVHAGPTNPIVPLGDEYGTRDWHSQKDTADAAMAEASHLGGDQLPAAGMSTRPHDEPVGPFFVWTPRDEETPPADTRKQNEGAV